MYRSPAPLLAVVAAASIARPALAHVGPSDDANNRYVKLTLVGDRIRLLYTFYVGERPGAALRARLDANRDGAIDSAEADVFGAETAASVAGALSVRIDGAMRAVAWDTIAVGLGRNTVNAGAFSVDLVAWLCLGGTAAAHELGLADRWHPPQVGETELRLEAAPGVTITEASLGGAPVSRAEFRWTGADGPLAQPAGLALRFEVAADAADSDTPCREAGEPQTTGGTRWALAALALLLAGLAALARRRYRSTNG